MTKYLSCEVCENKKDPLFKIVGADGIKHYICKKCIAKLDEKIWTAGQDEKYKPPK